MMTRMGTTIATFMPVCPGGCDVFFDGSERASLSLLEDIIRYNTRTVSLRLVEPGDVQTRSNAI